MKAHRNGAIAVVLCLHIGIGIMAYMITAKISKSILYKMLKF
ncbi:MAG: hypothetical protein NTX44_02845 [Ignavibacteriales bacterium]|nr:hypothetical protein [Ignavibacteriales bacterium]